MKLQFLLIYLFVFLLFGCNSGSSGKKERESHQKEIELLNKKKKLLDEDSILREKVTIRNRENTEFEESESFGGNYLVSDKSAGIFKIGYQIPFSNISGKYRIRKETQKRITEGPVVETIYIASENGNDILQLKPAYNFNKASYTQKIEEIIIFSEKFRTVKGIGINSTIDDFIKVYPDYRIWYTYVSGMYVIESKEIKAQFILNKKDFTGKIEITSDMIMLKKADFKSDAKILKIRII